jgi:hypothetical protein
VLAGRDCLFDRVNALAGRSRIEEDRMLLARKRRIEVGRPIRDIMHAGNGADAIGVTADQQQSRKPALLADGEATHADDRHQRIGKMLGRGDAAGRTVDDDADCLLRHAIC